VLENICIFTVNIKIEDMKKLFFIVVMLLIFANVDAQKIGVKGGFDLSTKVSTNSIDYGFNPGMNASIFFQKGLLPFLSIRPELGYYQKGYSYELLQVKHKIAYDYLELNVVVRLKVPIVPVYVIAGPYGAYALGGEHSEDFFNTTTKIDFGKGGTLPFDFGLAGGVGYVKSIAIMKFFAEVKYEMGMFNINDSYSASIDKNRNLAFSVGLMIGL
jgi:Outer membrane protein beta-barrel domain